MRLIDSIPLVQEAQRFRGVFKTDLEKYVADMFIRMLDFAPTIEAEPVKHGRWEDGPLNGYLRCSVCKDVYIDDTWLDDGKWNYCPTAGRKWIWRARNDTYDTYSLRRDMHCLDWLYAHLLMPCLLRWHN